MLNPISHGAKMQVTASAKPIYAPASLHRGCAALLSAGPPQEGQRFAAGPLLFQSPTTKAIAFAKLQNLYAQAPEPVYVHTQLLRALCMTAILHRIFIHTSKKEENKLPHLEPRIQRVKDSKPPGFKDSSIKGIKDSSIQGLKGSRMERLRDSCWGICSKNNRIRLPELNLRIPPKQSIRRHLFQSTEVQT